MKRQLLIGVFTIIMSCSMAQKITVEGTVYEDRNQNGQQDNGEKGIPNVVVSNQEDVVLTDKKGRYQITVLQNTGSVFVCKPSHYKYLLDENNVPRRHYVHRKEGSPDYLRYEAFSPMGEWPKTIDFPLIKAKKQNNFTASVVADPQTYTEDHVDWYSRHVLSIMYKDEADLYIALGDIAWDNLDIYKMMNDATKLLNRPIYPVIGNHDINFKSPDRHHAMETYMSIFGPDYYSFNEGNVHFVALNNISYHGWKEEKNSRGYYHAELYERQLTWLKNDLKFVPKDQRIVLLMHIPIDKLKDREALFEVLKDREHLLALSGHTHKTRHTFINETDSLWKGKEFHLHIVGSGSGMRYKEPKDFTNAPSGLSMDGAPQGYYVYQFDDTKYNYEFVAAKRWENKKMHIASPFGIISSDSLKHVKVVANIYDGESETNAHYWINDEGPYELEQFSGKDPYYGAHTWMSSTPHLWGAELPNDLSAGTYLIRVVATDRFGNIYEDEIIFTVK